MQKSYCTLKIFGHFSSRCKRITEFKNNLLENMFIVLAVTNRNIEIEVSKIFLRIALAVIGALINYLSTGSALTYLKEI